MKISGRPYTILIIAAVALIVFNAMATSVYCTEEKTTSSSSHTASGLEAEEKTSAREETTNITSTTQRPRRRWHFGHIVTAPRYFKGPRRDSNGRFRPVFN